MFGLNSWMGGGASKADGGSAAGAVCNRSGGGATGSVLTILSLRC